MAAPGAPGSEGAPSSGISFKVQISWVWDFPPLAWVFPWLNSWDGSWGSCIQHLQLSMVGLGKINFRDGLDSMAQLKKVEEQKALKTGAKPHHEWMQLRTLLRAVCSC